MSIKFFWECWNSLEPKTDRLSQSWFCSAHPDIRPYPRQFAPNGKLMSSPASSRIAERTLGPRWLYGRKLGRRDWELWSLSSFEFCCRTHQSFGRIRAQQQCSQWWHAHILDLSCPSTPLSFDSAPFSSVGCGRGSSRRPDWDQRRSGGLQSFRSCGFCLSGHLC